MVSKRIIIICNILLFFLNIINAQTNTVINFSIVFGDDDIIGNDSGVLFRNDSLKLEINELKFYVSNIQFLKDNKVVFEEKNSFHLIDASTPLSQKININNPQSLAFDEITYSIGIDSITNVSGALGDDLDPTKGMYWAWQSGYINFKLEGKKANKEFTFHLGGYKQPFYCMQNLSFPINNSSTINMQFDVKHFIEKVEIENKKRIMSPSNDALLLSKELTNYFSVNNK